MSLGGRPPEQGGHKACRFSLDAESCKGLEKIKGKYKYKSLFIEEAIKPLIRQFDPGESCQPLKRIDRYLVCEISSAMSEKNYEKANALTSLTYSLEPFRRLCKLPRDQAHSIKQKKPLRCRTLSPFEHTRSHKCPL